jgi:aldehyde dehydrogenase (NAD+)
MAARAAFDRGEWSERPAAERAVVLRRFADALASRAPRFIEIISAEAGCPRYTSVMGTQVQAPMAQAHQMIDFFISLPEIEDNPLPLAHRVTPTGQVVQSLRRYMPVGVVAAISAYNFPFLISLWKVLPALLAGNTVILRPNPLTPLSAMLFAEAAEEAELPPGVLNVVLEAGIEGARLLSSDPAVDMVSFTGSTAVGTQVMIQAAPTMKRLQLELGGKSAQIFLPDALDRVPMLASVVCTAHAGQGCAHGTRIFVPQESKQDILTKTAALFAAIRVGQTDAPDTQMGPVISAAQVARCEHFVKLAVEAGGRVVTGGRRPAHLSKGHFFEPTLLDVPDNRNPAAQEEIFGPVVSVIGYRDLDHAVEMANDSKYALSGYVHGVDRRLAIETARRVRSGTVHVNTGIMSTYVSMGGFKASGVGRERGVEGFRLYQHLGCLNLGG